MLSRLLSRYPPEFQAGAREGFQAFLPLSLGLMPWGLVTGMAMVGSGFSPLEAIGMNLLVYAGAAQLGTLPLIVAGAPVWLIVATALAINLRFVIFSAGLAGQFSGVSTRGRWGLGYLLVDGVFAICLEPLLRNPDPRWRLGHYLVPSLWGWLLWQTACLAGILLAGVIPTSWSLDFMAIIALLVLLLSLAATLPMMVAAATGAVVAVALHGLPLRLGLFAGLVAGILAGFGAERLVPAREERS